jgi:hypothetical protein
MLSQLAVLPTCKAFLGTNPKIAVARDEQRSNFAAMEMLTRGRLPGDAPNPIETKQAEFGAQPEITVGRLSD